MVREWNVWTWNWDYGDNEVIDTYKFCGMKMGVGVWDKFYGHSEYLKTESSIFRA